MESCLVSLLVPAPINVALLQANDAITIVEGAKANDLLTRLGGIH